MKRPSDTGILVLTRACSGITKMAILPAATDELHHNGCFPYLGDKVSGIREMIA